MMVSLKSMAVPMEVLLLLLIGCSLVSTSFLREPNKCGTSICGKSKNFQFLPNTKYIYKYEAQIDTAFDVEKHNSSSINVQAAVELSFETSCHGTLLVSEVTMVEGDGTNKEDSTMDYLDSFTEHILRFYYEDGQFQEICPEQGETAWVLNFKRGILSAFYNSMQRLDLDQHAIEIDINGECKTHYQLEAVNGTTLIIGKSKDLASCSRRHQLHSIIPTANYVFQTKYHRWSPMVSSLSCKQFVDHNIITTVHCSEEHSFLPFYNQSFGASTSATISITLIEEKEIEEDDVNLNNKKVHRRTSLLYDAQRFSRVSEQSLHETFDLVVSMCELNSEELQPEFSEIFNKFIHIARYLPYESISQLYQKSPTLCSSGKKHVMDGLPHLRSSASIEVMKDILLKETLPDPIVSQFLFAMTLFNRAEADTIRAVTPLVIGRPQHSETYYAVCSLIYSFCKLSPNCEDNQHIQAIISHLEEKIQISVFPEEDLHMAVGVLKAIGNAGVLTPTMVTTLQKIIIRRDLPSEIRIAAISAHRRLSCGINQDFLLNVYQNNTNEEEIRIKAYLEVMKCPSYQAVHIIKDTLDQEQSNQVGSFVWSHLHNLKTSAMPDRMEIQAMLQNTEFSDKFNKGYFQFSRNYESSFYINEYGVGGFIVTNVIFSHKSYIPRSLSFNVTIILFGEAVNLGEVVLDLKGFEQYAETLFWKNGVLSKFEESVSVLRHIRSYTSNMRSKVDALPNVIAESFAVPKASISIRIFGNEVHYSRITGKTDVNNILNNLNPVKIIKDFLSGQEIKVEKSMLLCDARYVTPLAVGFPLNTDAVITSTVKLDIAAAINATVFTKNGQFDLNGKLIPSVAVNMVGSMAVDSYYKKAEVKVVSKIYTSTAVAGTFKLQGYKFAWISLNLPLKKSEIFSGNNKLVLVRGEKEIALQGLTSGRVNSTFCSWPVLDDALGLTFCVKSLLPNSSLVLDSPMVIFNGPLNVEVTLDKSDPSTQQYTLEYKISELEHKRVASVIFDTPGSTVKRGLTAMLNLDKDGPNVTLMFQTTRTHLRAQGFYRNTAEEMSLNFWLDMDGARHLNLSIALFVAPSKHGATYKPQLQFNIYDKQVAGLSGNITLIQKNEIAQCDVDLIFRINKFSSQIRGYTRKNNVSISTNLKLEYQFENTKQEYVRLETSLTDKSMKQLSKVYGKITLISSTYPQINTVAYINYTKGHGHVDCRAVIKTNNDQFTKNDYRKLVILTEFKYYKTMNGSKSETLVEIKKADNEIDLKLSVGSMLAPGSLSVSSVVRYSKGKEITVNFDLAIPKGNLLLAECKFRVTIPNTVKAMEIYGEIHEKLALDYDLNLAAIWFSGHNVTLKGSYQDKSNMLDSLHLLKFLAQSQLFKDIMFNGKLLIGEKEYKTDLAVDYNKVKYGLIIQHQSQHPAEMNSFGQLSINNRIYTMNNTIDMLKHEATLDLHLDQYRDIHINVKGPQSPNNMKIILEIKWDANRDPSQKLLITIQGSKGVDVNLDLSCVIEYPGRTISGTFSLYHKDHDYSASAKLEWSPVSAVSLSTFVLWDIQDSGVITFTGTILTPFDNWKVTHLNYGLWLLESHTRTNASLSWGHNGSALLDMTYKSLSTNSQVGFSITTLINSTLREVSPIRGEMSYSQSSRHIHTLLDIQSSAEHRVKLESTGQIIRQDSFSDYSANILFISPFQNLTSGELSANFNMNSNNAFFGGTIIALNDHNITSSFEGSAKTFNESKLLLTIHTPFQKYKKITGKFSFSASKAHLVAELKATTFTLGLRTIYMFNSMQDFDLELSAVTGVNFVTSVLLVATLNNETVDFRGGWNSVLVGLTARSHYNGWQDLEYRGSLFMPFDGFRESGAVAKLLVTDKFHLEVTAAVAKAKVGLKVVSMFRPEEDLDLSEKEYCVIDYNAKNKSILWRALFELDTLYYPTAVGRAELAHLDHHRFGATASLRLNVIDICLHDMASYKNNLAMGNFLTITTSHPILSELRSTFDLNGVWPIQTVCQLEFKVVSSNITYKFDMDGQYHFQPLGDVEGEGIYSLTYRLTTPFEAVDHCYFDFNLQVERFFFASNVTIDVISNRINMDGTLELEDKYLSLSTDFSIASPSFTLPLCHLAFTKDFSTVEKSTTFILKYPNKNGIAEEFELSTSWHFSGENFVKISGHIVTPYKKLEDLMASFHYSSDPVDSEYNLELIFKNSNYADLRLNGKAKGNDVYLQIESSVEEFREVVMNGTLTREDGKYKLDSVVSMDQAVRMDVEITSSQGVPLFMIMRMMDNKRSHQDKDLLEVVMELRRKRNHDAVGYDLLANIKRDLLEINLTTDITSKASEDNWSFLVTSNHERYTKINLTVSVIPSKDQIFEISIKGHTDTKHLKADASVVCNIWFDGKKGRMQADLDSSPLSGISFIEWDWDKLQNMKGLANATYIFNNVSRDYSTHLFLRSPSMGLDNICIGTDINFDNKLWWFSTNLTLLMPAKNDISFTSFLLLPHNVKEVHSLVGQLYYKFNVDDKSLNQLLKYATIQSKQGLHTAIQAKMSNGALDGSILLEGGVNGTHFLQDRFSAKLKDKQCDVNSLFTSSFTKGNITVDMHYQKPQLVHNIILEVKSPGHDVVMLTNVNFETIENMQTNITCTTPISTMPHIGVLLHALSNKELFYRYGQLLWPNNSALINYTHTKSLLAESKGIMNDGELLLDFPLATRHNILLKYNYQENKASSSGVSVLDYNENTILKGNFSRQLDISELEKSDLVKIHVTNIYMPLGLTYLHRRKKDSANPNNVYTDRKRVEIFKVENTSFNIAGELNVEKTELDNTITVNVMRLNRSLSVRTVFCKNNTLHTSCSVILKPSVWASSTFYLYRKHNDIESSEEMRFGLAYPRRDMSITGAYHWAADGLTCNAVLTPGTDSPPLGASLSWKAESPSQHHVIFVLSHHSFEKDLTVSARLRQGSQEILHIDTDIEYALMAKRKLSLAGSLVTNSTGPNNNYQMVITVKHPISRFYMDILGVLEKKPNFVYAFNNFSYQKSFQPQSWNSSILLDANEKLIQVQQYSMNELSNITTKYSKKGTQHILEGNIINGKTTNISGMGFVDLHHLKSVATVNLTADATEQLFVSGNYLNDREAFFKVWRKYDDLTVEDVAFLLKLNHSRLLTTGYRWRTSIKQDIMNGFHSGSSYIWTFMSTTSEFWTDTVKDEVLERINEIWLDARPELQEFIDDITNVDRLKDDIVYFQTVFNESYEANEFFMQDIYNITLLLAEEIAFRDKMGSLPQIVSELWQVMGETGESVRQSILYLIQAVKNLYTKTVDVCTDLMQGNALQHVSQLVGKLSSKYDKVIKDLHVTFVNYVETLWNQIASTITESWNRMLQVIEPAFIEFVHYVDSLFWDCSKKIVEFLYQKQSLILNSTNLAKDSNFTKDLDKFFKDVTKNGIFTSFKKYTGTVFIILKDKYFKVVPFGYELTEISTEMYDVMKELYKLPAINFTIEATATVYEKVIWLCNHFNVGNKIQQALPFVYNKLVDMSHTALQNEIANHNRKTKFVFEPRRGELFLEQQLPMPWHSFNNIPKFEEIKEYKMITDAQKWLTPSNRTFWSLYYQYSPLADYRNWLPPYKGEAIIGRNTHFVTFDKKHFSIISPCSYLLAKDFVRNDFALVLSYTNGKHVIDLYIGPYIVEIDLISDMVTIPSHNMYIPANLNGTLVYFEYGIITIESDMGFIIQCNVKYDTCTIHLSGWYFGKTAGLLGTLDNEPNNDFLMSNGEVTDDLMKFTHGWLVDSSGGKCAPHFLPRQNTIKQNSIAICDNLFVSKVSQFSNCFAIVNPKPYYELCYRSLSGEDNVICTAAIMYIQHCLARNIPLRTPNICVQCQLYNNGRMAEGDFTKIKDGAVPQSTEVVFIIEAKPCNNFSTQKKSMPTIVNAIAKELNEVGLSNNRFALVLFGGDGVFDEPRNFLVNGEVFTSAKHISQLFSQVPLGNGNTDIFRAIRFATKMKFRAGVSKTFIVMTCSQCESNSTSFEYSVLQEVLIEKDITLHILMNNDFGLEKTKSNRILYGVDLTLAYTKNDFKKLKGDSDLRRQVKLSKHLMGYCAPLALDTNGTVFAATKLDNPHANVAKKFVSVLAKRVASSAHPSTCQNCECTADENGVDTIECVLCVYPTPNFVDFEFKDNSSFFRSLEDNLDFDYIGNDNI